MNASLRKWSDAELERYLDDELASPLRAAVTADLRRDAALRKRLSSIRRDDDLTLRGLLVEPRRVPHSIRPKFLIIGVLAPLAAALLAALLYTRASRTLVAPAGPPPVARGATASEYQAVRVLVLGTVKHRDPNERPAVTRRQQKHDPPTTVATADPAAALSRAVDQALAAGDVDRTLELLSTAPVDQRNAGYERMGALLRSIATARQVLNRLPVSEQLRVCSAWAHQPELQAVVYPRLGDLRRNPEIAAATQTTLARLAQEPGLRAVLWSYQLVQSGP